MKNHGKTTLFGAVVAVACIPGIVAVTATLIVVDLFVTFRDLRRLDRAGLVP